MKHEMYIGGYRVMKHNMEKKMVNEMRLGFIQGV